MIIITTCPLVITCSQEIKDSLTMNNYDSFDTVFQKRFFPEINFSDERERLVFLSYIRGFLLLILDTSVKRILEIGGGQSTALLATIGARLGWEIVTVDMNPEAIAMKIRSQGVTNAVLEKIHFKQGVSLSTTEIRSFYESNLISIAGVPFAVAAKNAVSFIDTTMDARKVPLVLHALSLQEFFPESVVGKIIEEKHLNQSLIKVFRCPGDEFEFNFNGEINQAGCLQEIMDESAIDVVFLDSGEFSSIPEWEIVERSLRPGGYVICHDIFFPKSFKNWLVCGSIMANPAYEILYIDRSTPQGLMVSRKK